MTKYLLTCSCGNMVPVEVGQAGGSVVCSSCGAPLDVPPLRKIRHLPVAEPESRPADMSWSARQGVVTAGAIAAAVLAAISLWSRLSEPTIPQFDPDSYRQHVERSLQEMTPAEGWERWNGLYRPMAESGFPSLMDSRTPAIEQQVSKQRFFQKMMLILAAFFAAIALAAAFWPRPAAPRRR